jgi:hypothetical protein
MSWLVEPASARASANHGFGFSETGFPRKYPTSSNRLFPKEWATMAHVNINVVGHKREIDVHARVNIKLWRERQIG